MTCQFFTRLWNRNPAKMFSDENVRVHELDLPVELATDLLALLGAAYAKGLPKGAHVNGCFEIQTDVGIWSSPSQRKLNLANATHQTWEEMEAADAA